MIELGFYNSIISNEGTWIKHPTSVEIGSGVENIGNEVFDSCPTLNSVTIQNSVIGIGELAFSGCRSLLSVVISDSVKTIGSYAFNVTGIESITLGNSVETIGNNAFMGCSNLKTITIPESVTSLGAGTFYESALTELIMEGKTMEQVQAMENYAWSIPAGIPIKCSDGNLEAPEGSGS